MNYKQLLIIGSFYLLNLGCASLPEVDSTPAKDIKPTSSEAKKNFNNLKKQIRTGKAEDNTKVLTNERARFKGTEFESELEHILAQEYYKSGHFSDAGLAYLRASRSSTQEDTRFKFCHAAGKSFQAGQDWDRLKKGVDFCLSHFEIKPENVYFLKIQKIQGMEMSGASLLDLAKAYVDLTVLQTGEQESKSRSKALQIIETMNQSQLEEVSSDAEFGFLRGHAAFRLGQIYVTQRNKGAAKNAFSKVVQLLPETDLAELAQKKIEQINTADQVNPSTLGVVLPLSGKHGSVGQKLLRGLQMGLGLDGESSSSIKLAVVDSEGNPDLARKGVERLVQEDNVIAVVGSLLSKTANAVADQSQVMNVPNLALSQKSGLTKIGDNIFRFAMTSETQVRYLVKKCMKDMGMRRFAIVYPNDKFGVEYANLFWDEVLARGGEIRAAQSYEPEENDFSGLAQRLVGTFYNEDRQDELKWLIKQKADHQKKESTRSRDEEITLNPVMDFDAIFVADGIKALGQISAMLAFNGVKGTKIIGSNIWNNEGIIKRVANSSNQILFVDAASVESKSTQAQVFFKQYKAMFNENPGAFELQGYEAGMLLNKVLSQSVQTRDQFRDQLAQLNSTQGVVDTIVKSDEREFTKPLYLYAIENNQIKVILR